MEKENEMKGEKSEGKKADGGGERKGGREQREDESQGKRKCSKMLMQ